MRLPLLGALICGVILAAIGTTIGHALLPVIFEQPITNTWLDFWIRLISIGATLTIAFWQPWKKA